jgi:flagellar FliL protein
MTEEQEEGKSEEQETPAEKPAKKFKLPGKWMIIGAAVAAVLLIGSVLAFFLLSGAPEEGLPDSAEAVSTPAVTGPVYPMEKFIVNLNQSGGERFLETSLELEFPDTEYTEELQANMPRLKDAILLILSNKSFADIQGIEGKIALRKELILKINTIMKKHKIRNLYYTEFVYH